MTGKQCHPERSEGSRPSARCAMPIHGAVCSHASRRAAAGRYFLRLSMRARRFAPNAHASLRNISPCGAARRSAVVTPPDAPRSGRLARFTPARGRSITTPSQHVRPALRAARPRFAALLSSCAQGSALLISSVSLCQRERSAFFLTQLAAHLSPLRRSFVPPLQRRLPSGTPEFRLQNSILAAPPCREAGRGPRGNWFPLESRSRILCATVTAASVTAISSHASHACAGGRHLLRLSMRARRFAPNPHASLRMCLPAHAARRSIRPPPAARSCRSFRYSPR